MTTTAEPIERIQDEVRHPVRPRSPRVPPLADRALVESDQYEWTTPLNLPGLVVASHDASPRTTPLVREEGQSVGDLIESEDGDIASARQLPGRLGR